MEIGKCYYVRTLSDHWIGRVVEVQPFRVTLEDACWVADSGRLHVFLRDGKTDNMEIEPCLGPKGESLLVECQPNTSIEWVHPLFKEAV